ncbi:MAG: hypothetical protein ABL999_18180 [Pyrinomonadaceae bacterium]
MGKTLRFSLAAVFCCAFAMFAATAAHAQPSDAALKKQLTAPRTVSITLGSPGKVEWSKTYKKYIWTRNFTAKLKTDDPKIFLLVTGYAAYDVMTGRYVYWRTFTSGNSYDGIPNPTAADVQALIKKFGVEAFMRDYWYNHVVGQVESIGLSPEPNFEWHTPNSMSFNIVAVYTHRTNDIGGKERGARTFRIRLYRDSTTSEWKNLGTTDKEWKIL